MTEQIARQRQSPLAILVLLSRLLKSLVKQVGWLIIVLLIGGNTSDKLLNLAIFAGIFVTFSLGRALVAYFRSYYSVHSGQLIVEKGFLQSSTTNIPLDRIQAVDFDQTLVHKLLNVVKVVITTAGSSGEEANVAALQLDRAHALRDAILQGKSSQVPSIADEFTTPESEPIVKLGILELLKIGLVENHFRSAMVIVGFGFWVYQQAEDVGIWEKLLGFLPDKDALLGSLVVLCVGILLFLGTSLIVSMITVFIRYFNLSFIRQDGSFKLSYGLFDSREVTAKDSKVQTITWRQSWLQNKVDYSTLYLKQASSKVMSDKKSIVIPGCRQQDVDSIVEYLFADHQVPEWHGVSPAYRFYHIRNTSIGFALLIGLSVYLQNYLLGIGLFAWYIYSVLGIVKLYRKLKFSLGEAALMLAGGSFGSRNTILEPHKVQSVSVATSLFQRSRGLASVNIYTASGSVQIPFLPEAEAAEVRDRLLYLAESSSKPWM